MSDNERGEVRGEAPKPKITSETKEKNPGRVAAGKKLAAMNRARMSRTVNRHDVIEPTQHEQTVGQRSGGALRTEGSRSQVDDHDTTDWSSPMVLLTVIGVVSGLGCLYYTYKQDKRSDRAESQIRDASQTLEEPQSPSPSSSSGGGNLKSFD